MPAWCESIEDVPADLVRAVQYAYRILSWFENFQEEDLPEQWMWPFDDLIDAHFEAVREAQGLNDGGESDDVESEQNELTAGLRERMRKA